MSVNSVTSLHHPIEMQNYIFDAVMEAGEEFGIRPFGIRAMDSLRLEKSYRLIPREMSIEYSAYESGLDRFIRLDKEEDFIGKQALIDWRDRGFENAFVTLEVHDVVDADARGSEAIYKDGKLVGRATSGGYGFRVEKSLALGLVSRNGPGWVPDSRSRFWAGCTMPRSLQNRPTTRRTRCFGRRISAEKAPLTSVRARLERKQGGFMTGRTGQKPPTVPYRPSRIPESFPG